MRDSVRLPLRLAFSVLLLSLVTLMSSVHVVLSDPEVDVELIDCYISDNDLVFEMDFLVYDLDGERLHIDVYPIDLDSDDYIEFDGRRNDDEYEDASGNIWFYDTFRVRSDDYLREGFEAEFPLRLFPDGRFEVFPYVVVSIKEDDDDLDRIDRFDLDDCTVNVGDGGSSSSRDDAGDDEDCQFIPGGCDDDDADDCQFIPGGCDDEDSNSAPPPPPGSNDDDEEEPTDDVRNDEDDEAEDDTDADDANSASLPDFDERHTYEGTATVTMNGRTVQHATSVLLQPPTVVNEVERETNAFNFRIEIGNMGTMVIGSLYFESASLAITPQTGRTANVQTWFMEQIDATTFDGYLGNELALNANHMASTATGLMMPEPVRRGAQMRITFVGDDGLIIRIAGESQDRRTRFDVMFEGTLR